MYNINYDCRYYKEDVFLETDQVNDQEKDFIRDVLYKEDLMNIFDMEEYDTFDSFTNKFSDLYQQVKNYEPLHKCMKKLASDLFTEDMETGFYILYSYHYMYITHKCISEYLQQGSISDENIKLLEDLVFK
jgi:hypothetical protein